MIADETVSTRRNREEIIKELSEIIDRMHEKHSWQAMERITGLSTQTLQNVWRGETPSLRTAVMLLNAVGYKLKIIEKD
jgi:hypothetical protein